MCQSLLPLMQHPNTRIINVSSIASHLTSLDPHLANRFRSAKSIHDVDALADDFEKSCGAGRMKEDGWSHTYGISKSLINALTRVMASENPDMLINCCCPGKYTINITYLHPHAYKTYGYISQCFDAFFGDWYWWFEIVGWCDSEMGRLTGYPSKTSGQWSIHLNMQGQYWSWIQAEGASIPLNLAFGDIGGISGEYWEEPSVSSIGLGRVIKW